MLKRLVKKLVIHVFPDSRKARVVLELPKMRTWRRQHADCCQFSDRQDLCQYVHSEIVGDGPLDYLEFGVFRGQSLKFWMELNQHADSRFFGFDTFAGLPEDWLNFGSGVSKDFNRSGIPPEITDHRIDFVKGLFQDTLDGFLAVYEPRPPVILYIDADLYSSALYVLTRCHHLLVPGTVVLFDEFASILHEFRALEDYSASYRRGYNVLGVVGADCDQIAIRMR